MKKLNKRKKRQKEEFYSIFKSIRSMTDLPVIVLRYLVEASRQWKWREWIAFIIMIFLLIPIFLLLAFKDDIRAEYTSIEKRLDDIQSQAYISLDHLGNLREACQNNQEADIKKALELYIESSRTFTSQLTGLKRIETLTTYCTFYGLVNLANDIDALKPNVCAFKNYPMEDQIKTWRADIKTNTSNESSSYAFPSYRLFSTIFSKSDHKGYLASECSATPSLRALADKNFNKTEKNNGTN